MERREFLKAGVGLSASGVTAGLARPPRAGAASTADATRWRAFEVTTRAEIIGPLGATRAWLPLPLMPDTDYQKSLGQTWTGNAAGARVLREEKYGAGIFYAEWTAGEAAPVIEVTARFATRDRAADFTQPGAAAPEDKEVLTKYLGSTHYIPTDGVVGKTSREVTKGLGTDVDKVKSYVAQAKTGG